MTVLQLRIKDMTLIQDFKDVQLQQDTISINEHDTFYININPNPISEQYKSISSPPILIYRPRNNTKIFRVFVRVRQFSFSETPYL